jgi:hypothetical protein
MIYATTSVSKTDQKKVERLFDFIEMVNKSQVRAGFLKDRRYEDGSSVINVAYKQEFGGISSITKSTVPPRPFIRPAFESNRYEWINVWKDGVKKIFEDILKSSFASGREKYTKLLERLGGVVVKDIKYAIDATTSPPLALFTKMERRRRGNYNNHPLIDTGLMKNSISYRIETKE